MPLIKCRDGVHRSPLAALDYLDPVFVPYEDAAETPIPDRNEEPPAPEGDHDVRR